MTDIKPRIKIQVGVSSHVNAVEKKESLLEKRPEEQDVTSIGHDSGAATIEPDTSKVLRMIDLCAGAYMQKNVPRTKHLRAAPGTGGDANPNPSQSSSSSAGASLSSQSAKTAPGAARSSNATAAGSGADPSGSVKRSRHEAQQAPRAATGPQVEMIDGKIVLKESSLVVQEAAPAQVEGVYEEVEEGTHAVATYKSFLRDQKYERWGIDETRRFFVALRQCGTEFSLMQSFFPGRTRKQLKMKFMREEREHPELVKQTLYAVEALDTAPFQALYSTHASELASARADGEGALSTGSDGAADGLSSPASRALGFQQYLVAHMQAEQTQPRSRRYRLRADLPAIFHPEFDPPDELQEI